MKAAATITRAEEEADSSDSSDESAPPAVSLIAARVGWAGGGGGWLGVGEGGEGGGREGDGGGGGGGERGGGEGGSKSATTAVLVTTVGAASINREAGESTAVAASGVAMLVARALAALEAAVGLSVEMVAVTRREAGAIRNATRAAATPAVLATAAVTAARCGGVTSLASPAARSSRVTV